MRKKKNQRAVPGSSNESINVNEKNLEISRPSSQVPTNERETSRQAKPFQHDRPTNISPSSSGNFLGQADTAAISNQYLLHKGHRTSSSAFPFHCHLPQTFFAIKSFLFRFFTGIVHSGWDHAPSPNNTYTTSTRPPPPTTVTPLQDNCSYRWQTATTPGQGGF